MSLELVHSEIKPEQIRHITRLIEGVADLMAVLTAAQVRTCYGELETARDGLSLLLDKADRKT
jgi:hypothetical protein